MVQAGWLVGGSGVIQSNQALTIITIFSRPLRRPVTVHVI